MRLRGKSKILLCLSCEKPCRVPPYRWATFKFCSHKCLTAHNVRLRAKVKCRTCNKIFDVIKIRQFIARYCSSECYHKAMTGRGSIAYVCRHCGKKFQDAPSHKRVYCSRACVNKTAHKSFKPTYTTVRKTMERRGMLKQCARCGFKKVPQILGVHHKDRKRSNNALNNLEVLCPNCHSIEHQKHIAH